jgi:hypothetical protein
MFCGLAIFHLKEEGGMVCCGLNLFGLKTGTCGGHCNEPPKVHKRGEFSE